MERKRGGGSKRRVIWGGREGNRRVSDILSERVRVRRRKREGQRSECL